MASDCCFVTLPKKPKRKYHEVPSGAINCANLTFTLPEPAEPDTLVVKIDGHLLDPVEYSVGSDNQTITLILADETNPNFIQEPPRSTEKLTVDYTPLQNKCFAML